jgi:hypothetical protein
MPRFSPEVFLKGVVTLMVLFSPQIPFWVQLYFLCKIDHGDIDVFVDEEHRDEIRSHVGSNPTFKRCPDGDQHRDRMTIDIDGVDVLIEFKYSKYSEASAFAGSYGGFFHILLLHSLRGMYGQNMSIVDGHVVFTEGKVVVQIMTLHEFLVRHNFNHSTSQDHAFLNIDALFDAWSKSTCFNPSYVIHAFQKTKKRDERAMGMYTAFTAWLSSNGFNVEELKKDPMLTSEQCQQKAEEAFPEACRRFQQALYAEKEAVKRIEDAKNATYVSSIIALGAIDAIGSFDKSFIAPVSRILRWEQTKKDKECPSCQKCIALHEQFKAMHGGGDIYTAITTTVGTEVWIRHVKEMWDIYIGTPTTTQEEN